MKLWEYAGFTAEEGDRLGKIEPAWLDDLPDDGPIPLALIDLAPGHDRPSPDDVTELRRFAAFLRQAPLRSA